MTSLFQRTSYYSGRKPSEFRISPINLPPYKKSFGICSLVCHDQIQLFVYMLYSFFLASNQLFPVVVVDDGTLDANDKSCLQHLFPNITLFSAKTASRIVTTKLQSYRFSYKYRKENNRHLSRHNIKLFDPIIVSGFQKFILMDADILFFRRPTEILRWIKSTRKDILSLSSNPKVIHPDTRLLYRSISILAQNWGVKSDGLFNSGIICSTIGQYKLSVIELYLSKLYEYRLEHTWFGEQLIFSIMMTSDNAVYHQLPSSKYVLFTENYSERRFNNCVCLHYHAKNKDAMIADIKKFNAINIKKFDRLGIE